MKIRGISEDGFARWVEVLVKDWNVNTRTRKRGDLSTAERKMEN